MNQAEHTIEKCNSVTESYDKLHTKKIDDDAADKIVLFLADCVNIEGFYRHTIIYSDGRKAIKYSTYNDVQGMITAREIQDKRQAL